MSTSENIAQITESLRNADIFVSAERYYRGEMSPTESALFRQMLETDAERRELVHFHHLALRATRLSERKALRHRLDAAARRANARPRRTSFRRWGALAVAAGLLLLLLPRLRPATPQSMVFAEANPWGLQAPGHSTGQLVAELRYLPAGKCFFVQYPHSFRPHFLTLHPDSFRLDISEELPRLSPERRQALYWEVSQNVGVRSKIWSPHYSAANYPTVLPQPLSPSNAPCSGQAPRFPEGAGVLMAEDLAIQFANLLPPPRNNAASAEAAPNWRRPNQQSVRDHEFPIGVRISDF
ncbi:MAG: hypothetical protein AAGN35_13650 [Bacteroidota bacterium]